MSVIVVGMKMPKDCTECRFAYDGRCFANYGRKEKIDVTNYCPLIELPAQHGRLIDADALCEGRVANDNVVICAKTATTIIEAEGVSE